MSEQRPEGKRCVGWKEGVKSFRLVVHWERALRGRLEKNYHGNQGIPLGMKGLNHRGQESSFLLYLSFPGSWGGLIGVLHPTALVSGEGADRERR